METENNWIEIELFGGTVLARGYAHIYLPYAKDKNITLIYSSRTIGVFETVEKAQRKADLIEAVMSSANKISLEFNWDGLNLLCNGITVATADQATGTDETF